MPEAHSNSEDHVRFDVAFTHQLRFTRDVFTTDAAVLRDVLHCETERSRCQFWLDEAVATANPGLRQKITAFCRGTNTELAGNIQTVVGGEDVKNDIHIVERMLKCFHHANLDRRSYIVVIGGGAVLDAVGFAAAIAHRGIRLVRIPTTTLAQADSGIGVKNSINLFQKKNWVGTFAVPWAVINDRSLLTTLSQRDFVCGFSEAVKVALLKEPAFFARIRRNAKAIVRRDEVCWSIIEDSARWHLKHITEGGDAFEMLEARPLDFGHWSAHKLEAMTNFGLRHGEAVAIGVAIDVVYSSLVHGLSESDAESVLECLQDMGLLMSHPVLSRTDELFDGLEEFRQHLGGRLTVTMLDGIGSPVDVHEIDRDQMKQAIARVVERVSQVSQRQ